MASPEPLAFAIYEDQPKWQEMLVEVLERRGHSVAILEDNKPDALKTIAKANYQNKKIWGVFEDGQLLGGPSGNLDGVELVDAILALNLGISIFSFASIPIPKANYYIDKANFDNRELGQLLASIGA